MSEDRLGRHGGVVQEGALKSSALSLSLVYRRHKRITQPVARPTCWEMTTSCAGTRRANSSRRAHRNIPKVNRRLTVYSTYSTVPMSHSLTHSFSFSPVDASFVLFLSVWFALANTRSSVCRRFV